MSSIPFLSALFGTSSTPASAKMTYPDARSDDEWRTVLNKGSSFQIYIPSVSYLTNAKLNLPIDLIDVYNETYR